MQENHGERLHVKQALLRIQERAVSQNTGSLATLEIRMLRVSPYRLHVKIRIGDETEKPALKNGVQVSVVILHCHQ